MRKGALFQVVLIGLVTASAGAVEIWTDLGGTIAKFDSANPGAITNVGVTGELPMDGMDFTSDGTLYGVADRELFRIDQTNGSVQSIGVAQIVGEIFMDLSWDPVAQQMYAIDSSYPPILYRLDLNTAAATMVGPLGISPFAFSAGLATTAAGVRYVDDATMSGIWRLDGLNPTSFLPEAFIPTAFFGGMTIHWRGDGLLYHGAFDSVTELTELWIMNLVTGVETFSGVIGNGGPLLSIAIKPEPGGLVSLVLLAICGRCRRRA